MLDMNGLDRFCTAAMTDETKPCAQCAKQIPERNAYWNAPVYLDQVRGKREDVLLCSRACFEAYTRGGQ